MKSILITLFFTLSGIVLIGQTQCDPPTNLTAEVQYYDVILEWAPPVNPSMKIIESFQRTEIDKFSEASQNQNIVSGAFTTKDYMDMQFYWETHINTGEAGVACDGDYFYTTAWNDVHIFKYDLEGNFLDSIIIDGVANLRNLIYCETDGYYYGSTVTGNPGIYILDFENDSIVDHISIPTNMGARAMGYNPDLDVFYTNNWSSDFLVVDRVTRSVIDTIPLIGTYSSYYGFAYDNVSYGGPYLWGFSQDNSGAELVQMNLPGFDETGVVINVNGLLPDSSLMAIAGGLYVQQGIVDTTVTLGGLLQNSLIFGLELGYYPPPPPPTITEFNIYRNDTLINSTPVSDTIYYDQGLTPGTYNYYATAVYSDTSGSFICESDPSNIAVAYVVEPDLILGGNVFAGNTKLTNGMAHAYSANGDDIIHESSVEIDDLGYYFFFPFVENDFYVFTTIDDNSAYSDTHIQTYYGDVFHWEDSPTIHLQNNLYNQDINLIEIQPVNSGFSNISGYVSIDSKGLEPVEDILLLLLNSDNQIIGLKYTDFNGYYNFTDLGFGTYSILCEIIGKKMQPKLITLNQANTDVTYMNFVIHDTEVVLGIGDDLPNNVDFISEVYPNPASLNASISINVIKPQKITIEYIDINGRIVESQYHYLNIGNNVLNVPLDNLESGVVFTRLLFEDGNIINRKLIIR